MIKRLLFALLLALSSPALAAPAFVQAVGSQSASSTANLTLGATPTAGNLVLGWVSETNCSRPINNIINTSSWTVAAQNNPLPTGSSRGCTFMLYRYVQIGDTTALPAMLSSSQAFIAYEAVEISGVNGTFKNDFENQDQNSNLSTSTVNTNANSFTTQANNDLVVTAAFNGNASSNITGFSGYTLAVQQNNSSIYGAIVLAYKSFSTSGSSFTSSYTAPNTGDQSNYLTFVVSGTGVGGDLQQATKTNTYVVLIPFTAPAHGLNLHSFPP